MLTDQRNLTVTRMPTLGGDVGWPAVAGRGILTRVQPVNLPRLGLVGAAGRLQLPHRGHRAVPLGGHGTVEALDLYTRVFGADAMVADPTTRVPS
jgi:hypothetical protein